MWHCIIQNALEYTHILSEMGYDCRKTAKLVRRIDHNNTNLLMCPSTPQSFLLGALKVNWEAEACEHVI